MKDHFIHVKSTTGMLGNRSILMVVQQQVTGLIIYSGHHVHQRDHVLKIERVLWQLLEKPQQRFLSFLLVGQNNRFTGFGNYVVR